MAIVQAGGRTTAITEGSCEFCSVLETVSETGKVISLCILMGGFEIKRLGESMHG